MAFAWTDDIPHFCDEDSLLSYRRINDEVCTENSFWWMWCQICANIGSVLDGTVFDVTPSDRRSEMIDHTVYRTLFHNKFRNAETVFCYGLVCADEANTSPEMTGDTNHRNTFLLNKLQNTLILYRWIALRYEPGSIYHQ